MFRMLKSAVTSLGSFLKATISEWSGDNVGRLSAALAFYAVLSISPLFVILIAIVGSVYGERAARGEIVNQIEGFVGPSGAQMIERLIAATGRHPSGAVATVLAVLALFFGASGFFGQLQSALNTIWGVTHKPGGNIIIGFLKNRLFSSVMVLLAGVLLIVLIAGTSFLWTLTGYFREILPLPAFFWQVFDFTVSFVLLTLIFGLIFKVVPDAKITWKDVWVGATVTSFLFTIGQFLLGLYLGRKSFTSSYGVAGSFVIVLVWIYYSAQVFLIGAEMTQVYSRRYGKEIEPADNAIRVRTEIHLEPQN